MLNIENARPLLAQYLSAHLGSDSIVEVEPFERITIGHSRGMHRINVHYTKDGEEIRKSFALRAEQGGMFGGDTLIEVRLQRAVRNAGIPAARIRWVELDANVLGEPFFIMDWVEGSSGPPDMATMERYILELHEMHKLDWRKAELPLRTTPSTPLHAMHQQIDHWLSVHHWGRPRPSPLIEEAATWLKINAPKNLRMCLVHGDPGPANFIHKDGSVQAFTDWEFSHIGDPNEDWLFLSAMRGRALKEPSEWRHLIQQITDTEITDSDWFYWDIYNHFKGSCANTSALRVFTSGANMAPNMAAIGTGLHMSMLQRISQMIGETYNQPKTK